MKYHLLMVRHHGMALQVHWLWLVFLGAGLGMGFHGAWPASVFLAALLCQGILHEVGHALLARCCQCSPRVIVLHPVHGQCRYGCPADDGFRDFREAVIAWGGVLAQSLLLIPALLALLIHGWGGSTTLDMVLLAWGPVNGFLVLLNLLPVGGLDGAHAWHLVTLLRRYRAQLLNPEPSLETVDTALDPLVELTVLEPDPTDLYHMLWLKCFYDESRVARLLAQEQQRYPRAGRTELLKHALSRFDRKLEDG